MYHCYFLINYTGPPKVFFLSFGPLFKKFAHHCSRGPCLDVGWRKNVKVVGNTSTYWPKNWCINICKNNNFLKMATYSRNLEIKSCLDFTYILCTIFKHNGDALPKNLSCVWSKVNYVRVWHSNILHDYVYCVCNCLVFGLLKENRLKMHEIKKKNSKTCPGVKQDIKT